MPIGVRKRHWGEIHCQSENLLHICFSACMQHVKKVLQATKPLNILDGIKDTMHHPPCTIRMAAKRFPPLTSSERLLADET